jgi:hypothetical protein
LEPPFGDGGAGYDNYGNGEGNYDENYQYDFSSVKIKKEPSDKGYPAEMPNIAAPPPPQDDDMDEGQD